MGAGLSLSSPISKGELSLIDVLTPQLRATCMVTVGKLTTIDIYAFRLFQASDDILYDAKRCG